MEANDFGGLDTAAAVREMLEHLLERHVVVVGGGVPQREQPLLLHDCLEEEAALALDGTDEVLEGNLGNPFALSFDTGDCSGVGLDRWFVGGKCNLEAVERVAVPGVVGAGIIEEAREAIFSARDIDGLEEVGQKLADALYFIVSWGAHDGS